EPGNLHDVEANRGTLRGGKLANDTLYIGIERRIADAVGRSRDFLFRLVRHHPESGFIGVGTGASIDNRCVVSARAQWLARKDEPRQQRSSLSDHNGNPTRRLWTVFCAGSEVRKSPNSSASTLNHTIFPVRKSTREAKP